MTNTYINSCNYSVMYKALYLSPMIPSYNLRETAHFFKDTLQFEIARDDEHYIIMYKDHCTIHLLRAGNNIGEMEFYLEVNDVDEVWNLMKSKVEGLKVREPSRQETFCLKG